jgi:phosphoribosylformylglycinamidine (FGAM) synthase-like enzyme
MRMDHLLFSESSGMVLEIRSDALDALKDVYARYDLPIHQIGDVQEEPRLEVTGLEEETLVDVSILDLRERWLSGLPEALFGTAVKT